MLSQSTLKFGLAILYALPVTLSLRAQDATPQANDPYPAGIPLNYVRSWDALSPVTDPNLLVTKPRKEVMQTSAYVDGLGRPLQTVVKQGSLISGGLPTDFVNVKVYDEYGREVRSYLPFASVDTKGVIKFDPFQQQQSFYNTNNPNSPVTGQGETFFYGKTELEASPLNRPLRIYAPGNSWVNQGKGTQVQYLMNTINDKVRIWNVADVANDFGGYSSTDEYIPGTLFKTITTDERNNQVIEFKNKEGQVILKKVQVSASIFDNGSGSDHENWICTYYIYDDYNQLRAVIQPEGVDKLRQNGWNITDLIVKEQFFRYEYDQRNRMIMKKVPGADPVQMVYDARDRLVMTQDANMRQPGQMQWLVTTYDDLNRPVATYLITDPGRYNDAAGHRFDASSSTSYPDITTYTNEQLTETHYDNYDGIPTGLTGTLYNSGYTAYLDAGADEFPDPIAPANSVIGLVTWTRTKVLGENKYIVSCNIYDDKKRVIQVQTLNYTDALDIITSQYSFSGQLLRSHIKHQKGGSNPQNYELATKNSYDDLGRIVAVEKNFNNGGWKRVTEMTYDAIGEMKTKTLSPIGVAGGAPLETLAYEYNIRGWLLGANRQYAMGTSGTDHYFGFDLGYDKQTIGTVGAYDAAQYNGNITGTVWKSKGDGQVRKYDFAYDPVNRLINADFKQYNSGFVKDAQIDFTVDNLTYDLNGNIQTMWQKGIKGVSSDYIDKLTYHYYDHSNKLMNVVDDKNDVQTTLGDFRSSQQYMNTLGAGGKTALAIDYDQDLNGNLKYDHNKDIQSITYNYLNLPQTITIEGNKGSIDYVYDAAGNKLKKVVHEIGKPDKTTLYLFGTYEDDVLQFLPMEDGRIRPVRDASGAITSFTYDYFVKDHLGNVRSVLTEEQKTSIYQAGMEDALRSFEVPLFGSKVNSTAEDKANLPLPGFDNNSDNHKVSKLDGTTADGRVGPGVILKVMAGDKIKAQTLYWYKSSEVDNNSDPGLSSIVETILGQLVPAVSGVAKGALAGQVTNSTLQPGVINFVGTQSPLPGAPKAYLNYVLLDEEQLQVAKCGATPIAALNADQQSQLLQAESGAEIEMPKNGYLYVYVSNESKGNVYFDDIRVEHIRGPLLEETHYYPFGLTMAGISSKAASFGSVENKRKFNEGTELQNKEFSDGNGLELYQTPFRSYDAQIGRFHQIDPWANFLLGQSPYAFGNNNPILINDPTGLFSDSTHPDVLQTFVVTATVKKLEGGEFDGMLYSQIEEWTRVGGGGFSNQKKERIDKNNIIPILKKQIKTEEDFGKYLKAIGTLAGGSPILELRSIEDFKGIFTAIKTGKINPAALTLVMAASCIVMQGEKSEGSANQLTDIMNNYISLHSSATTDKPTEAKGIYIITYFSGSAGTGGGGMYYKDTYYDVATRKILGVIHDTN
jgi:RHS repeat-associated protein